MCMTPSDDVATDPRWARIVARDKTADGAFWYSVSTTGIYCRPSCPSRAARPEHVTIHPSLAAARASGARPCRRCNPDGSSVDADNLVLIERSCRTIEQADGRISLAALADAVELSPGHFHRLFKAVTGLTPRGYAVAHRARLVRDGLAGGDSVTCAIQAAGYGSSSRFYAESMAVLGMTPARYRAGGAEETLRFAVAPCALGSLLVASSERGIAAILLGDDPTMLVRELAARFPRADLAEAGEEYARTVAAVVALVEAPGIGLDLALDVRGTAFQQRVWQALRAIPAGETISYAEIARRIGVPGSTRAVAGACAANAIAVAIPCHRVVRADGTLSGYRWGPERKRALLAREAAAVPPPAGG
jgi:AraC family transcriptional regulator of adaptative response/methylated-DNA-[protein]-cysteine methyltransferase